MHYLAESGKSSPLMKLGERGSHIGLFLVLIAGLGFANLMQYFPGQ
jgi:hypothetical protein